MTNPFAFLNPLEIEWERAAESAIETVGHGLQEVGKVSIETSRNIMGLDMKGNFTDFGTGKSEAPNVAKTPELLTEEQRVASEINRKREFFTRFNEDLQRIQNPPPTPEIDALTYEAATMETGARNTLDRYQEGYKREYTSTAYGISITKAALMERDHKQEEQMENIPIPSPAKQVNALEGVFEGASGKIGSGTANLSAISGAQ